METYYLLAALIFFLGLMVWATFVVRRFSKKKKLSDSQKKDFQKKYAYIKKGADPKAKLIDYDKLYHKILEAYGYTGTFGEILKQNPNEVGDLDRVWKLHKLRNKLVHEFDLLSVSVLKKHAQEYEQEIKNILR